MYISINIYIYLYTQIYIYICIPSTLIFPTPLSLKLATLSQDIVLEDSTFYYYSNCSTKEKKTNIYIYIRKNYDMYTLEMYIKKKY
jgi:hypothetical protein